MEMWNMYDFLHRYFITHRHKAVYSKCKHMYILVCPVKHKCGRQELKNNLWQRPVCFVTTLFREILFVHYFFSRDKTVMVSYDGLSLHLCHSLKREVHRTIAHRSMKRLFLNTSQLGFKSNVVRRHFIWDYPEPSLTLRALSLQTSSPRLLDHHPDPIRNVENTSQLSLFTSICIKLVQKRFSVMFFRQVSVLKRS